MPNHHPGPRRVAALTAAAVIILAGCGGSAPPSAQCKRQVARVAALQYLARQEEAKPFSSDGFAKFTRYVHEAGALLKKIKAEGCPDSGY